jgi:hypothetical protein
MKIRAVGSIAAMLPLAGGATGGAASASLPPPVISDLHVTNFDPFTRAQGGFNTQGFDFENSFTNNKFTLSVGGYSLAFDKTFPTVPITVHRQ